MTPIEQAVLAVLLMGLIILATRTFPFALFSRKDPPAALKFVERYIPPMVMAVLVVYCLKDVAWAVSPHGLREVAALAAVVVLHLLKRNALISIFGGTALYMFLIARF